MEMPKLRDDGSYDGVEYDLPRAEPSERLGWMARSAQKPCQRDLGGGAATTLSDLDQHLYLVVQLVPVDNRRDMPVVPRRTWTYCSTTLISTKCCGRSTAEEPGYAM